MISSCQVAFISQYTTSGTARSRYLGTTSHQTDIGESSAQCNLFLLANFLHKAMILLKFFVNCHADVW